MSRLLEVIVTSAEEAVEAQKGGADRLELLAAPELAGLTPSQETVEAVLQSVSIPVRVMLRDQPEMSGGNAAEVARLVDTAGRFAQLPIDGIVAGFTNENGVDEETMLRIAEAAGKIAITFHRAFDKLAGQPRAQIRALECLKRMRRVDRLLTHGRDGVWEERLEAAGEWQRAAAPEIRVIFAAGREIARFAELKSVAPEIEIHAGRGARHPHTFAGKVSRASVAAIRDALDGGKRH